jgi:hypothetical protein
VRRQQRPEELTAGPSEALAAAPASVSPTLAILNLQRAAGNAAVARLLEPAGLRTPYAPAPGTGEAPPEEWGPAPVVGQPVSGTPDSLDPTVPVIGRPVSGTPDEGPIEKPIPERDDGFDHIRLALRDWPKLKPIHNYFSAPSFETFVDCRVAFLITFGWPAVSEDVAYERAIAYYTGVIRWTTFMGHPVPVHPDLDQALKAAEKHLGNQSFPLQSLGGCNIRFNVNSPGRLSEHSYGWAIDINGDTSPNVKRLKHGSPRARMIEAITGIDVTEDAEGNVSDTDEQTAEEMLEEAERLQLASERFVAAFEDEVTLAVAGQGIAEERGDPVGTAHEIGTLMFAAGAENVDWWRYEPYEPNLPPPRRGKRQRLRRDAAHQELARFIFPVDDGQETLPWDEAVVRSTVDLLAHMARTYKATFVRKTKKNPTGRVRPEARDPSDAQLALHGFMSVPPEVVAALSGSDAGNLRWLGTMSGHTKDYMHFELRHRPKLY